MFTKVDGRQERDKSYGKCQSIFMNTRNFMRAERNRALNSKIPNRLHRLGLTTSLNLENLS
jgi:hypothetical protein